MMMKLTAVMAAMVLAGANGFAQRAPNVSQVLTYSTLTDKQIAGSPSLFSVYTFNPATPLTALGDAINQAGNYRVAHSSALSGAISANVAVALSVIPFASPTSGVILKKDPATGALLPSSSSLGPIFTQRAETVGKGSWYIGFTQQNFHFSEINGQKLNGLSLLYSGGDASGIPEGGAGTVTTKTAPATYNVAMDVRLSQNLAVITYGLTNRLDVSVGLAMVHARVDSTAYNAVVYTGNGLGFSNGAKCWCVNTFQPGVQTMNLPQIGRASYGKSGFGDMVVRVKGNVFEGPRASLAVGTDLRLPTGDSANYLGIGTTAVKPFAAMSLYSKPTANGIIFAPHFEIGWQISGKSNLGGTLSGAAATQQVQPGVTVPVFSAPLTVQKGYVPDILSWSVGTEVAIGRRNTLVLDVSGNQIGLAHGAQLLDLRSITAPAPTPLNGAIPQANGLTGVDVAGKALKGSFAQYSGSFGYKVKIAGNLVATFQAVLRMNSTGLTARFVPLYGLGYSF